MPEKDCCSADFEKAIEERFGVDVETLSRYAEMHRKIVDFDFPCKPGDAIYVLRDVFTASEKYILEYTCSYIDVVVMGNELIPVAISCRAVNGYIDCVAFKKQQFGESVFCSKSEAESAFKKREDYFEHKMKEFGKLSNQELERRREILKKIFGDRI